jgi:hypothetical protein
MGHAGTPNRLDKRFLDDTVLDVERQLAGPLLGSAPADTVGQPADVADLLSLYPFPLLRDGCGPVICAFCDGAHMLHFRRIHHTFTPLYKNFLAYVYRFPYPFKGRVGKYPAYALREFVQ